MEQDQPEPEVLQPGEYALTDIDSLVVVQGAVARQRGVEWGGTAREAGFPDIASMIGTGFSDAEIEEAIKRQVRLAELPESEQTEYTLNKGNEHGIRQQNLPGSLSTFFYTDKGQNIVRSVIWCDRWSITEAARMFNLSREQLESYLKSLGWSKQLQDKAKQELLVEFDDKTREAIANAKNKCADALVRMAGAFSKVAEDSLLKPDQELARQLKDLTQSIKNLSPENAPAPPAPALVGIQINHGVRVANPPSRRT